MKQREVAKMLIPPPDSGHSQSVGQKRRESNVEAFRIMAMFLIVLEHMLINGTRFFEMEENRYAYVAYTIIGFAYIGVNCFLLITGYFSTEWSLRRLANLYLTCAFYELLFFVVYLSLGLAEVSQDTVARILFPLSHSSTWFIPCYTVLLFASPLLNKGLETLTKQQYTYCLVLLTVINLYFGWFWRVPKANAIGYSVCNMIYLYVVGGYIRRYVNLDKIKSYKFYFLSGYIFLAFCWCLFQSIHKTVHVVPHWSGWSYNNPVVIGSALLLFMFFLSLKINSRWINVFARTMFAVFIVHMNTYFGGTLCGWCHRIVDGASAMGIVAQVVVLIGFTMAVMLCIALIDLPRLWVHKRILQHLPTLNREER